MGPRTITGSRFDLLTHYGSPYSCSPPRHLIDNDGRLCWPNNCTRVSDENVDKERIKDGDFSSSIPGTLLQCKVLHRYVCTQRGHVVQVLSGIDASR